MKLSQDAGFPHTQITKMTHDDSDNNNEAPSCDSCYQAVGRLAEWFRVRNLGCFYTGDISKG